MAFGNHAFQSQLSPSPFPPSLPRQTHSSLLHPSLPLSSLPLSSTLLQVSLPHSAGGLLGVKACIHHSPLPLPPSRLWAKEPPWKESSLSLPLPANWREQRNKLFPSPCSPLHPPPGSAPGPPAWTGPWAGTEQTSPDFLS